jgi:peptidyl-prolyl cis-trans isomerase C
VSAIHRLLAAAAAFVLLGSLAAGAQDTVVAKVNGKNQLFADAAESQKLATGAALAERLQYWRRRSLRDLYFDKTLKDAVSEADARSFYDTQVGGAKPEEEVRARHILLESKEKAREVFEKIAHGDDFVELAKRYSRDPDTKNQGGDLGFFARGQMPPPFEEAVFKLANGEVAQPFQTQFGWHVARLDERREQPPPAFEEVKDRIRTTIIHQKAKQIVTDLRGKAQIEYVDPEFKGADGPPGTGKKK